jgi:hypothetical protein
MTPPAALAYVSVVFVAIFFVFVDCAVARWLYNSYNYRNPTIVVNADGTRWAVRTTWMFTKFDKRGWLLDQ